MTAPVAREGSTTFTVPPPAHRLPAEVRLGHVQLQIADLERSIAYYERVIGLRLIERTDSSAALGAHDDPTPLVVLQASSGAAPVPRRGRLGLFHFAILLPERAALGRFVAHLASISEYAGMADHLVSEAIYLSDPDGLGIEVYADRPRSEWRMHGRSIAMATLPLDAQALIAAGGGKPWTGAPPGTRIGHVHLHVSDLDQAAAFYHAGLGLDKVVVDFPGALFMSAGGYHHHLGTNTWAAGAARSTDRDARLLEWRIALPSARDVTAAAGSLASAGFIVRSDGADAVATDPWGTDLRLTSW